MGRLILFLLMRRVGSEEVKELGGWVEDTPLD